MSALDSTHPFKGETVQMVSFYTITRGYFKNYKGFFVADNPDGGNPITGQVFFDEKVAEAFRQAGHSQVKWEFSHKTHTLNHVDVILGTQSSKKGKRYCIAHVYASDGSVHEVPTRERNSKKSDTPMTKDSLAEHKRKRELRRQRRQQEKENVVGMFTKPANRFTHGESLHAFQRTNPFSLVIVDGEWELFVKPSVALAA